MSLTMIAISWSSASEVELIHAGFKKEELYIKYPNVPHTEEGISRAVSDVFSFRSRTPYQFIVAPYWGNGKKVGVVQILLGIREGTEEFLKSNGFIKGKLFGKHGSWGPTDQAVPLDEQEFLTMKNVPDRWCASAYWAQGNG